MPKLYVGPRANNLPQIDHHGEHTAGPTLYSMSSDVGQGNINYDRLEEQTESSSESGDEDLPFQLFEGEEMSAGMANFIGIHRI